MGEQLIGTVSHFFGKAGVAAIELSGNLTVGDTIRIHGHTSDFTQQVESMEIEHAQVESAKSGDHVGIVVGEKARQHDKVYRVTAA